MLPSACGRFRSDQLLDCTALLFEVGADGALGHVVEGAEENLRQLLAIRVKFDKELSSHASPE